MKNIKTIVNIALIIALYYLVYYIYIGIINPIPSLGDSWDYHIPIAKSILDGSFLHPTYFRWYYPGASEAFNSLFILFHIPLTLSNISAAIILFFCCFRLALTFRLKRYYALLFALTFITINTILRWSNAVSIDVWVGVFFALAIVLLENPRKGIYFFIKLGFVLGMLVGSKYNTWYFVFTLLIFYFKRILPFINIRRFIAFIIPFSLFGLFWYIRNFILTNNPFYPVSTLGFEGKLAYTYSIWDGLRQYPFEMMNAGFGEYKIWIFSVFIAFMILIYNYVIKKRYQLNSINKLFIIGLLNFSFFLTFPTGEQTWIMVSSFRYSFPVFIPLMLGTFMLAAKYKREELIGYVAIANMINVVTMAYYPKLVLIYLPVALVVCLFNSRKKVLKVEE